jgi:hypothetical protein
MTDEAKGSWLWIREKKFIKSQNIRIRGFDRSYIPFVGTMVEVFHNKQFKYSVPILPNGFLIRESTTSFHCGTLSQNGAGRH